MATSMKPFFHGILPIHIYKKNLLHHFKQTKNTVPMFKRDKIKSCFTNKIRSRSNKNMFPNRKS